MSRQTLSIGILAPLVSPIRQPYIGGAQALVRDLAVGLAARGHGVTLYAAAGSDAAILPGVELVQIAVDSERVRPTDFTHAAALATPSPADPAVEEAFARAYQQIDAHTPRHDLVHGHAYDAPAFLGGRSLGLPILHTLHLPAVDASINATLAQLAPANAPRPVGGPWLATVSHACAVTYACRIDSIVYNGIDLDAIPFGATCDADGHLLFAGRMTPEKGVVDAIAIALAANRPLTLVGGIYDQRYFDTSILPLLAAHPDQLTYLGPRPRERVWELMSRAAAVLAPSLWDEPFGLVACEANAAGAPVLGYDSGGLREIISQGETGVLVPRGDRDEAAQSVASVCALSRNACRQRIASRFSLRSTLDTYEALFLRMMA